MSKTFELPNTRPVLLRRWVTEDNPGPGRPKRDFVEVAGWVYEFREGDFLIGNWQDPFHAVEITETNADEVKELLRDPYSDRHIRRYEDRSTL